MYATPKLCFRPKQFYINESYFVPQVSEVRSIVAEGFCKLLLSGRLISAKLFSRLLLLWYNPITEQDSYLRHCLGAFFPIFAFGAGR